MRAKNHVLMKLYERSGGRPDRTLHAYVHVARSLAMPHDETKRCIDALIDEGLIETDPEFDRLIRLTARGVAACARIETMNATIHNTMQDAAFVMPPQVSAPPADQYAHGYSN